MGKVNAKTAREAEQERIERDGNRVRNARNRELRRTDWAALPDSPLSDEERAAVKEYRRKLRDVSNQKGFPDDVEWPDPPSFLEGKKG